MFFIKRCYFPPAFHPTFCDLHQANHPLGCWICPGTPPVQTAPVVTEHHITGRPNVAVHEPRVGLGFSRKGSWRHGFSRFFLSFLGSCWVLLGSCWVLLGIFCFVAVCSCTAIVKLWVGQLRSGAPVRSPKSAQNSTVHYL